MHELDLDDMQGLIARGYPNLRAARYVLLQIGDASSARRWLTGLADQITMPRHISSLVPSPQTT